MFIGHTQIGAFAQRTEEVVASGGNAEIIARNCDTKDAGGVITIGLRKPGANGGQSRTDSLYQEVCVSSDCQRCRSSGQPYLTQCVQGLMEEVLEISPGLTTQRSDDGKAYTFTR